MIYDIYNIYIYIYLYIYIYIYVQYINYIYPRNTATGTVFALTYSTLTMGYNEIKLYKEIENLFNITIKQEFLKNWKQYLHDCEILLNLGKKNQLYCYKF